MPKPDNRGLPKSFSLKVASSATDQPIDLPDYLDDEPPPPVIPRKTPQAPPPSPVVATPASSSGTAVAPALEEPVSLPPEPPKAPSKAPPKKRRAQVNLGEVAAKLEALRDHVSDQSAESNVHGNDILKALVLALEQSKQYLNCSAVPQRGRWGSPTAESFQIHLRNAFMKALHDWYALNKGEGGPK